MINETVSYSSLQAANQSSYKGCILDLLSGNTDVCPDNYTINNARRKMITFTEPWTSISLFPIVKIDNSLVTKLFFLLNPFTPILWFTLIAITVFTT